MPFDMPFHLEQIETLMIAMGVGLLIGLERERVTSSRAGLRTFALVSLFGALSVFLSQRLQSEWPFVMAMFIVAAMLIAAHLRHPDSSDPGTTSVAALMVSFCLGALVWLGHTQIAVMLSIATTILLYFKTQLSGMASRLTYQDWTSIFQFGVLSLVILPVLPNQDYGPYGALNPYQIWWMVVLISGVSLAGYAALQLGGARYGAPFVGLFGGMASSTATTMVFARRAKVQPDMVTTAALVILIANLVMVVRMGILALVVAPHIMIALLPVLGPALLLGGIVVAWSWRNLSKDDIPLPKTGNPTELKTALGFGLLFAVVLFCAAWLSDYAGTRGMYAVALISGLTDADAIVLTSLRLFVLERLEVQQAVVSIGLGMFANLAFKTGLATVIAGKAVAMKVLAGMIAVALGLLGGVAWTLVAL
jgi:uncharacterized membrane protein (DUF4010 family)